ncbi:MAG: AAA family ATPase [Defluviitaleaceae bacterium]|nr:AAA family ATPase [Defluviitaleaceae bacterium]
MRPLNHEDATEFESDELNRLGETLGLVSSYIARLEAEVAKKRGGLVEARREMWSNASRIVRDFDDAAEMSGYQAEVTARESAYAGQSQSLNNLRRMLDSPYFGRIDFVEDGGELTERIYIGGNSLYDEDSNQFAVYDWRAPISSMYYDFGTGRASYEAPAGTFAGTISLKRQYGVERGALVYMFDTDLTIDDEMLRLVLSKSSDAKIKSIVNSIQREQNGAIRCESENLAVFGPAGSGKTSVGLHRIAYLLYKRRGSLNSSRVRVFSPSNVFSSYISGIIPELGEEDVAKLDAKTLVKELSPEERLFFEPSELLEFLSGADDTGEAALRRECVAIKYGADFADFAENFIKNYSPSIEDDACFNGDMVVSAGQIREMYADRTKSGNLASKTARAVDFAGRRFDEYFGANKKSVAEFFDGLDDEIYGDAEIKRKFYEQREIVLSDLRARLLPEAGKLYVKIVEAYANERGLGRGFVRFTRESLRMQKLFFEDALVLLFIDAQAGKVKRDGSVRHIVVDEAQDMGCLLHKLLQNVFCDCRFTLLADFDQALFPDINITESKTLLGIYGGRMQVVELTKSYRQTIEINRFAAGVFGGRSEDGFFGRNGEEPEIVGCGDFASAAIKIIEGLPDSFKTVGVLLPDNKSAGAFYKNFRERLGSRGKKSHVCGRPLACVADDNDEFTAGVTVMTAYFAKGLEFDAVIAPGYGGAAFDGERGGRLLYLICTRALHRLYLLKKTDGQSERTNEDN